MNGRAAEKTPHARLSSRCRSRSCEVKVRSPLERAAESERVRSFLQRLGTARALESSGLQQCIVWPCRSACLSVGWPGGYTPFNSYSSLYRLQRRSPQILE